MNAHISEMAWQIQIKNLELGVSHPEEICTEILFVSVLGVPSYRCQFVPYGGYKKIYQITTDIQCKIQPW